MLRTESANEQNRRSNTMFGSGASPKRLTPIPSFLTKKVIQVVAACLLVVFMTAFVGAGLYSSPVYVNGESFYGEKITLKNEPAPAVHRANSQNGQIIEIDANIETEISISNGDFALLDGETLEQIYSGNKYSVKGKVIIQISSASGEKAVLRLQNILSEREIILENNGF